MGTQTVHRRPSDPTGGSTRKGEPVARHISPHPEFDEGSKPSFAVYTGGSVWSPLSSKKGLIIKVVDYRRFGKQGLLKENTQILFFALCY